MSNDNPENGERSHNEVKTAGSSIHHDTPKFGYDAWLIGGLALLVLLGSATILVYGLKDFDPNVENPYLPYWLLGGTIFVGLAMLLTGWLAYLWLTLTREVQQLKFKAWLEQEAKKERERLRKEQAESKAKAPSPRPETHAEKLKNLLAESIKMAKELRTEISTSDFDGKTKETKQIFPELLLNQIVQLGTEWIELCKKEMPAQPDSMAPKETSND